MDVTASVLPATVGGLPLHPLVVHAVVVTVPLAIVGAVGISLWPAMRRHLGLLVLLFSLLALVSVPIATNSGETLRDKLGAGQLVKQHEHYADQLLPWSIALVLVVLLTMVVDLARRLGPIVRTSETAAVGPAAEQLGEGSGSGGLALATRPTTSVDATPTTRLDRALGRLIPAGLRSNDRVLRLAAPVLAVATIAVAVVLAFYTYKTGDTGAKAVWGGR